MTKDNGFRVSKYFLRSEVVNAIVETADGRFSWGFSRAVTARRVAREAGKFGFWRVKP